MRTENSITDEFLTLDFPVTLVDESFDGTTYTKLKDTQNLITIITKNNPQRLVRTLGQFVECPHDVMIIDDSTSDESRNLYISKYLHSKIRYHGRKEQVDVLKNIRVAGIRKFIPRLGLEGWTLGLSRNYALLLAAYFGYQHLLMVDDDILIENPDVINASFDLLHRYWVVGARTVGMNDDSIIGHLFRRVGVQQYDFITGQYMGVNLRKVSYFFPNLYNEDLIFAAFQGFGTKFARCGVVRQLDSDYLGDMKSRSLFQEFGEILLDGTVLAVAGRKLEQLVSSEFWREIIQDRTLEIMELQKRLDRVQRDPLTSRVCRSVRNYHRNIKPHDFARFFVEYLGMVPEWRGLLTGRKKLRRHELS